MSVDIPNWGLFCPVTLAVAVTATIVLVNRTGLRSELPRRTRLALAALGGSAVALLLLPIGLGAWVGCSDEGGSYGYGHPWVSLLLAAPVWLVLDRSYVLAGQEEREAAVTTSVTVLGVGVAAFLEFTVAGLSVIFMCNQGSLLLLYFHVAVGLLIPVAASAWARFVLPP